MTAKEFADYIALRHIHMRLNTWKVQAPNGHSVYNNHFHTGKTALTSTIKSVSDILRFGQRLRTVVVLRTRFDVVY